MKIARYDGRDGTTIGVLAGEVIHPVARGVDPVTDTRTVVELATAAVEDPALRPQQIAQPEPLAGVRLRTPLPAPTSLRDFYAFEQHVRTARGRRGLDMHPDWYELPVFYFSNAAAVNGPADPVAAPPRCAELDYELEVAVVLGRGGVDVPVEQAGDLVVGFTVMNDWSARDIQRREMALSMGPVKGKDFATTLGPWLVTRDEFAPSGLRDVPAAAMTARVNGVEYSRADLSSLWWSFAELVSYASESAPLRAGDVMGSGTCGTGCILELALTYGSEKFPWLRAGDEVELAVAGLGVLANSVVAAEGRPFAKDGGRIRPEVSDR